MLKSIALASAAMLAASSVQAAEIKHVFVIALENHNFVQPQAVTDAGLHQIFGNAAAPFINSLVTPGNPNAAQTSFASNYVNVPPQNGHATHPSEPNYVWSEAGKTGPLNDATPFPNNIVSGPSLSAALQASGQSWKSYQEGIDLVRGASGQLTNQVAQPSDYVVPLSNFSGTSADYTNPYNGSNQFNYAAKHNPEVFFNATNGGNDPTSANPEAKFYAPLEQLAGDLAANTVADYNFITPDQFNDMHTALNGGFTYGGVHYTGDQASIAQGDNFLSMIVPLIMASQAYQDNGAIVIWNDETEGDEILGSNGLTSTEIVISPLAKGNAYTNMIQYDHSSDLRTWQELFNLDPVHGTPFFGGAAGAQDLRDLFKDGAVAVPEPATWAVMLLGFGLVGTGLRRRVRAVA